MTSTLSAPPENPQDIADGCIIFEKKIVLIRKGLTPEEQKKAIAHEIGHYYTENISAEDLETVIIGREIGDMSAPVVRVCSAKNEKRKYDIVEMSADLFDDYRKGTLSEKYPKLKELYDRLTTM